MNDCKAMHKKLSATFTIVYGVNDTLASRKITHCAILYMAASETIQMNIQHQNMNTYFLNTCRYIQYIYTLFPDTVGKWGDSYELFKLDFHTVKIEIRIKSRRDVPSIYAVVINRAGQPMNM